MLTFSLGNGIKPGGIIDSGKQAYTLNITSTVDLEIVEIMVNGQVVQTLKGIKAGKTTRYQGFIEVPEGGWVAARAYSTNQRADSWPTMHARPFAHSSPIWIKQIGSTDKTAKAAAAADLISAINAEQVKAKKAYGDRPMPRLYQRFNDAKKALEAML